MGKVGGSSWLAAVKRAFRSPTKDNNKKTSRSREDHDQEDEEKKRGKRRWIFRKPSMQETVIQHSVEKIITTSSTNPTITATATAINEATDAKQRHALAVAMATTAAAQAAVATAQAAVEVARLTRPTLFAKKHFAAIAIQTAFRGYLARRALRALKGLVKLQALVRGHNVRKRAKMTLHCMQALMRVQARVRDQRKRLSYEGSTNSTLSDPNSLWGSHFADRKSIPRDETNTTDEWVHWDENPQSLEEIQVLLQETKEEEEVALKREKALAHAFSHQIWIPSRDTYASEGELEEKPRCHDQWTRRKQLELGSTIYDQRESIIKTVEVDTYSTPYTHKPHHYHLYQKQRPSSFSATSPLLRSQSNVTPSPSKATPQLQVHSASPRYLREDRNNISKTGNGIGTSMPNYMAATASAKARLRSQSAPRQRASTPEREKIGPTAKKRLSFPNPVTSKNNIVDYRLKSPSHKQGIHEAYLGMEHSSTVSSCYTESSIGDEASPPTNELNRWLR